MSESLSIFSTIEDLRSCSDLTLLENIGSVRRDVVHAYILELRDNSKQLGQLEVGV